MSENPISDRMLEIIHLAMNCMAVAASIIDREGALLYYNRHAEKILDRKPEYIGTNIRTHHKKADSNDNVDAMLAAFEQGRKEPFHYEARPYGEPIIVTLSPIREKGEFIGCVQTVRKRSLSL